MANDTIFVRIKGRTLGPISMEKAVEMARNGQITPQHEVSVDRVNWKPAALLPGLFSSSSGSRGSHANSELSSIPWDQINLPTSQPAVAVSPSSSQTGSSSVSRDASREMLRRAALEKEEPEDVPTHLIPAILCTLFCCLPGGIVAIVYASKTGECIKKGDIEEAKVASSYANLWVTISALSWAVALLVTLFGFLILLLLGR